MLIVLDMQYHGELDYNRARQEICFSIARTVCEDLELRNIGYRLVTNAVLSERITSFTSEGGMGGSFRKILYALGMAKNGSICSLEETMRFACSQIGRYGLIVFISTRPDAETADALRLTRSICGANIVTLFANELLPTEKNKSKKKEREGGTAA